MLDIKFFASGNRLAYWLIKDKSCHHMYYMVKEPNRTKKAGLKRKFDTIQFALKYFSSLTLTLTQKIMNFSSSFHCTKVV